MVAGEEMHLAERRASLLQQAAAAAEAHEAREEPGIHLLLFTLASVYEIVDPGTE